jgi:predicted metal-dependent enzyme (double-stranded beta helix superfamily)
MVGQGRAMRFDKDEFVAECLTAVRTGQGAHGAVKDIVERAVSNPAAIEAEVRPWSESPMMTVWHRSDELTALHIVWPPEVDLFAHDHNMWAVIGLYGGREDNQFYRRLEDGRIEPHTGKTFLKQHVARLGPEVVHSVSNPTREWTAALHVYGGEFFTTPRTMWNLDTYDPMTFDPEVTKRILEDAAAKARIADIPGEQP